MKAIAFHHRHNTALLLPPAVDLIPDSAITLPNRPLFLPDFDFEWMASFYLAVRISRLGKGIASRFADRYFDAATLAMKLLPVTLMQDLSHPGRSLDVTNLFDGALSIGSWIPLPQPGTSLAITVNGACSDVAGFIESARVAVEAISRFTTLKQGDIILPLLLDPQIAIRTGLTVTASIGNAEVINLRIK